MADTDIFGPCADGNWVEFSTKEHKNQHLSAQEGRPIYVSMHWVKVISPGDTKTAFETPMTETYIQRYHDEYENWKRRKQTGETGVIGTSLMAWPQIDRARAAELADMKIISVEMLAAIKDGDLHRFGPNMRELRSQAQNFLAMAKGQAPITALQAENESLRAQLAAVQQQMTEVVALVKEKGGDPDQVATATTTGASGADSPLALQAQIADAVAKAVAAALPKATRKSKGKPRGRPFPKKQAADAETQPAA